MEKYTRFNVPKDLIEIEIEERRKYNKLFGEVFDTNLFDKAHYAINNENGQVSERKYIVSQEILEYARYEKDKIKNRDN